MTLKLLGFDRLIYVGIRDIDDFEGATIKKFGIKHFSHQQAIDFINKDKKIPIHISFDVDALDPVYVSSTGTRVDNGMHPEEVRGIIDAALQHNQLKSLDVVEFNPQLGDPEHSTNGIKAVFRDFFPNKMSVKQ